MNDNSITITSTIAAPIQDVWACWTSPKHIVNWNFASPEWHCPTAKNDLRPRGSFCFTMAARDGSAQFNLEGFYTEVMRERYQEYTLLDGRDVEVCFRSLAEDKTEITQEFEAESTNPVEMQRAGWQAILDNFKGYVEGLEEVAKMD